MERVMQDIQEYVKSTIRSIPDFPKKGIIFRDITTAIKDKKAFKAIVDFFAQKFKDEKIDYVVGIESRGFIFGAALAIAIDAGFIVIRKPNKLPAATIEEEYTLEYGTDKIQMHVDAIEEGKRVVLVDDLLATGGTMAAACRLVKKVGAKIIASAFVIELSELNGKNAMPDDINVISMI